MAMGVEPRTRFTGGSADVLLAAMAGGTYVLILLGIYTAAIGAGLTCEGRWPLCDGAVFGLFPANWTSFVEWFHRLVAMVTGILILVGWTVIWRRGTSHRALAAMSTALVLLPLQIWLGRETVLGYEIVALTAHFLTALIIFGAIVLGVAWYWGLPRWVGEFRQQLLLVALVLYVPFVTLTPQFLFVHSGEVQMFYYGIGLLILVMLLLVAIAPVALAIRAAVVAGVLSTAVQLLAGRLVRSDAIVALDWGAAVVLLVGLSVAYVLARRSEAVLEGRQSTVR